MLHADGVAVWFVEPLGMVVQLRAAPAHYTGAAGTWVTGPVYSRLLRVRGARTTKMHFLHDYSKMQSYDTDTRVALTGWGLRVRKEVARIVIAASDDWPLTRLAVSVAAAALTVAGLRTDVVADFQAVIAVGRYRPIRDPAP